MRAVSLVDRLEFEFTGTVLRNALTLGDVDNDGYNELIVASDKGNVTIFKGQHRWQTLTGLGFVTCVAVGDVLNKGRNYLVIVSGDGYFHVYGDQENDQTTVIHEGIDTVIETSTVIAGAGGGITETDSVDGAAASIAAAAPPAVTEPKRKISRASNRIKSDSNGGLSKIHTQRIPANTKVVLMGDIDGDGLIEIVLGLTDRVVRSYRWFDAGESEFCGKLVGLNKWECANQIGSVTLHHTADGTPCLLVAQPGGTFMRIRCKAEDLESDSKDGEDEAGASADGSDSNSESLAASLVDYQFLGLSRMRNQNISTEIVGDFVCIRDKDDKGNAYAVATLDGTIMLVQDEIILWAMAVDHQVFALNKLDMTGNGLDDIVACSWDGQTYILDQDKNSIRFHLDESVQAFCSGNYGVIPGEKSCQCLVYVTFHDQIYIYYDIPLKEIVVKRFEPDFSKFEDLVIEGKELKELNRESKRDLVNFLLYDAVCKDDENNV